MHIIAPIALAAVLLAGVLDYIPLGSGWWAVVAALAFAAAARQWISSLSLRKSIPGALFLVCLLVAAVTWLPGTTESTDLYAYDPETEGLVDTGCDMQGDQVFCLEDRDRSLDYDWHLNLPCPPMVEGPLSISAAGTVLYRLSPEEYAEACED